MVWHHGRLEVARVPGSRNPVFFRGRDVQHCLLTPGEHFVIGTTTFTLSDQQVTVSIDVPQPTTEQQFSAQYLRQLRFRNADRRIDALSRLPDIILGTASENELFVRLVSVLLTGVPRASAVAVVALNPDATDENDIEVFHWDQRVSTGTDFRPSQRLIRQAVGLNETVVHDWKGGSSRGASLTHREDVDWAFCTPVAGANCPGWALYIEGQDSDDAAGKDGGSEPGDLRDNLKFAELAATTLSNLREVRLLERSQASLSQFFSPLVLEALAGEDLDVVLAPREANVSVFFCDLRGFSRQSEQFDDDLLGLLRRVSGALGVMTRHILTQGGVVGDFHGDSAMGFWGWPLAQEDAVVRACRAALEIRAEFEQAANRAEDPLLDFRMGIGIATGKAVAGKIGTADQVKVTVFGPVVNLAARLEGMTKAIRAPILLDEATARIIREQVPSEQARTRRLAVVRPYGMETSLEVNELLPPASEHPALSDEHVRTYEAAVEALLDRDWSRAFDLLHQVPANDRVKDFLTVFIAQHNRIAPAGWDGVIPLSSK